MEFKSVKLVETGEQKRVQEVEQPNSLLYNLLHSLQ